LRHRPGHPIPCQGGADGRARLFRDAIDTIPDFITWFGYADDAAVLAAAIRTVSPHIRPGHHRQARAALDIEDGGR